MIRFVFTELYIMREKGQTNSSDMILSMFKGSVLAMNWIWQSAPIWSGWVSTGGSIERHRCLDRWGEWSWLCLSKTTSIYHVLGRSEMGWSKRRGGNLIPKKVSGPIVPSFMFWRKTTRRNAGLGSRISEGKLRIIHSSRVPKQQCCCIYAICYL